MATTNLFDAMTERNKLIAKANGGEFLSGADAFQKDNKARRRNLDASVFHDGDVVTVPFLPNDASHPEDKDKWIALPISKGGDPVTRCLVAVKDKDGKESVKELFAGTMTKFVVNRENNETVFTSGSAVDAIENCVSNTEIWETLAGKQLKFHSPKVVKTVIRGFNGRPDREGNQTVWTIDLV
jgi:hypothetical protein